MLGLYQDNENENVPLSTEDVVKNIIEEIHSAENTHSASLQHRQAEPGQTVKRATVRQQEQSKRNEDKAGP